MRNKKIFIFYSWTIVALNLATIILLLFSWIANLFGLEVNNLLSLDGIRWILRQSLTSVEHTFPFLALLLLCMGVGIISGSGFLIAMNNFVRNKLQLLSFKQRWSLQISLVVGALYILLIVWGIVSPIGNLLSVTGELQNSPLVNGFSIWFSMGCCLMGGIYGWLSGNLRHIYDFIISLLNGVKIGVPMIVLAYFCMHFLLLWRYVFY
ncbi:MAG: AbgT family transporter [Bacteroidaceae bacterium]|nr:AbgT family transporter [Bacteroidaceae bacterium]